MTVPELPASKGRLPSFYLLLVFFSLTAGIVTTAFLYYRNYEQHYRMEVESQLSAIAELKVGELADWRAERLADALLVAADEALYQAKAEGRNRVAYAIQDGRGSRAT